MRYSIQVRTHRGQIVNVGFARAADLAKAVRDRIARGYIVQSYTVHKTWDGRDWVRPISDLRSVAAANARIDAALARTLGA